MKLSKKHKMYVRPHMSNDSVVNLAKQSAALYLYVFQEMVKPYNSSMYQKINKDVKHWKEYQPVDLHLDERRTLLLKAITKKETLVVYINGSWRPLAKLHPFKNK